VDEPVITAEVRAQMTAGGPVVALESTLISHGLPYPHNLTLARDTERIVRSAGAVPATIGVLDGVVRIGLDDAALVALAAGVDVVKLSARDLGPALATGRTGGTTISATAHLAATAGIRVFATGGLGGVHRREHRRLSRAEDELARAPEAIEPVDRGEHRDAASTRDVSADLDTLARTPIAVVCSGVKSLLDVPATVERLESLGILVLGYRTDEFPGFYVPGTGIRLDWRVEEPESVAAVLRAAAAMNTGRATVVANPIPREFGLERELHDRAVAEALAAAAAAGVTGKAVTPFLLQRFLEATGGASLAANIALVKSNAELAARIAVALAD